MQLPDGVEVQRANPQALSGMTVWNGEANGCKVQWVTADWELVLYVKPIVWLSFDIPSRYFEGVALVDKDGKQYAMNGRVL